MEWQLIYLLIYFQPALTDGIYTTVALPTSILIARICKRNSTCAKNRAIKWMMEYLVKPMGSNCSYTNDEEMDSVC